MKKIAALLLIFTVILIVVVSCSTGGQTNETSDTSSSTTQSSNTIVNRFTDEDKTEKTVKFGGTEKVIKYKESIEYSEGGKYDVYFDSEDEYRYVYGTDTLYMIRIVKFGEENISCDEATVRLISFFSGELNMVDYKIIVYADEKTYHKLALEKIDGGNAEYSLIRAYIPMSNGVAEFWFE